MNLNQLIYFREIAKVEHFRIASEKLNISQPSLSKAIYNLEQELGVDLFNRNGRNIQLTKYGHIFLQEISKTLDDLDHNIAYMQKLSSNKGKIDIGYVSPLAINYIPNTVRNFLNHNKYTNTNFSFSQKYTSELISGLKNNDYDVVFCSYVDREQQIIFQPIIKQKLIAIMPKNHQLSKKDTIKLKDLYQYPIIGYENKSGLGKYTHKIYVENNISPNIICESPDENGIAALVGANFGVALVADVEALNNFNIIKRQIDDIELNHIVYMAYLKDNYQIPIVKKFITYITKYGTQI